MKAVVSVSGLLPLLLLFPTTVPGQDNGLLFQISPREYYALLQLYDQTGGAAWQNNEGWLDPDATQWRGVTVWGVDYDVDGDVLRRGFVIGVSLPNNALRGELPASIGNLSHLRTLDLGRNRITGIPEAITNVTALTTLNLSGNHLAGNIPPSLFHLPSLRDLSLADNQLTGTPPPAITNLAQLSTLDLSGNQLSGFLPDLSRLPLESVSVTNNFLETTGPSWKNIQTMLRADIAVSYLPQKIRVSGSAADGVFNLSWNAPPGARSQVQYKPRLEDSWLDLGTPVITDTNRSPTISDSDGAASQRFYRVILHD